MLKMFLDLTLKGEKKKHTCHLSQPVFCSILQNRLTKPNSPKYLYSDGIEDIYVYQFISHFEKRPVSCTKDFLQNILLKILLNVDGPQDIKNEFKILTAIINL